jgi:hypothetical protein
MHMNIIGKAAIVTKPPNKTITLDAIKVIINRMIRAGTVGRSSLSIIDSLTEREGSGIFDWYLS